jgi:hypothetical protein
VTDTPLAVDNLGHPPYNCQYVPFRASPDARPASDTLRPIYHGKLGARTIDSRGLGFLMALSGNPLAGAELDQIGDENSSHQSYNTQPDQKMFHIDSTGQIGAWFAQNL